MSEERHGLLEVYSSVGGGAGFFERLLTEWENSGWLVKRYHAIDQQEYRARHNALGRIWRFWRMYGFYAWTCYWRAKRSHALAPLRVVTTNPFYAPAMIQHIAGNSGNTINLLYDLYPDALELAEILRPDSLMARRCAAVTRFALRECSATVFLGEHLRQHSEMRYGSAKRAVVIPVGADGNPYRNMPPKSSDSAKVVTLLYAGQMGRLHEVETLRCVLAFGLPAGLQLVFHASGSGYAQLRSEASSSDRCSWGGPLPDGDWHQMMTTAHVALVTIARGAENVVMPSKTYSALVAGQAILAICTRTSDLANLVLCHDCGWVVEPGDVNGLLAVLNLIVDSPLQLMFKRANAYKAGHENYDMSVIARLWEELFESLKQSS
jgi:glycosyltransferase involved in cell wall biosynthesis